jgi:hypothetical protein
MFAFFCAFGLKTARSIDSQMFRNAVSPVGAVPDNLGALMISSMIAQSVMDALPSHMIGQPSKSVIPSDFSRPPKFTDSM